MTTDRTLSSVLVGHVIKLPGGDVVEVVNYERVGVLWLHARVVEPVTMTRGVVFQLDPTVALDAELQEVQEHQQPAGGAGPAAAADPAPAADRPGDGSGAVSAAGADAQAPARSRPTNEEAQALIDRFTLSVLAPVSLVAGVPAEECARCGTVGPVDVPCRGCRVVLQPGDESPAKPCCRRLGSVWCTRTDTHAESACRGPEEREMPVNALDRGRVRA